MPIANSRSATLSSSFEKALWTALGGLKCRYHNSKLIRVHQEHVASITLLVRIPQQNTRKYLAIHGYWQRCSHPSPTLNTSSVVSLELFLFSSGERMRVRSEPLVRSWARRKYYDHITQVQLATLLFIHNSRYQNTAKGTHRHLLVIKAAR